MKGIDRIGYAKLVTLTLGWGIRDSQHPARLVKCLSEIERGSLSSHSRFVSYPMLMSGAIFNCSRDFLNYLISVLFW